jgi:hypothetical protein
MSWFGLVPNFTEAGKPVAIKRVAATRQEVLPEKQRT